MLIQADECNYFTLEISDSLFCFTQNKEGMLANFMNGRMEGLTLFYNKQPQWNERKLE